MATGSNTSSIVNTVREILTRKHETGTLKNVLNFKFNIHSLHESISGGGFVVLWAGGCGCVCGWLWVYYNSRQADRERHA